MATASPDGRGGRLTGFEHKIDLCLPLLDKMPVAVSVLEARGGEFVLWRNKVALRILGLEAIAAWSFGQPPSDGAQHLDGTPYVLNEHPLERVLLDGADVERERMFHRRSDGRLLMLETSATRLEDHGRQLGICSFQDVTAEYEAGHRLSEAAERVELALDAGAIVSIWVWNIPDDVITTEERFARAFGLDPERGRTGVPSRELLETVHPDDRAGVEDAFTQAIRRGGPYRHRYRVLLADGYRWVEASGRVEFDAEGRPVRFPGVLLDIEASKQAEDARNLLIREVDHRARNALAMVQSIVRLTDAADPTWFREEVIGRVDAMARAQGTLSRSNWEGGVLEELVRDELSTYVSESHFALVGPKLTLPADQVQPLSMIMHELATNALKHGALSSQTGEVGVSWRRDTHGKVELVWEESGGPPVIPPRRKHFGSRLMERLSAQLGGVLEFDWRTTGLFARLAWEA